MTMHNLLLHLLVRELAIFEAVDIKADHITGYVRPDEIFWTSTGDGHIPDASATLFGQHCIFEVETCDRLNTEDTQSQFDLFGEYSKQHRVPFFVIVPSPCRLEAVIASWRRGAILQVISY